jgi:hypothetical protein
VSGDATVGVPAGSGETLGLAAPVFGFLTAQALRALPARAAAAHSARRAADDFLRFARRLKTGLRPVALW